ncbi:MAG: polysaccharide biosynthesis protein, partial [Intestinibacter sp.]|uniref:polysaccharide biosynthesis protein n=1 Tax=Intestinibacter sp. TaxID=1965304 RepID=UPI003F18921B
MVLRIMQKIDEISNDADKCKMRQVILACFDFIICVCSFIFTLSLLDMSSSSYYLLPVFIYAIINEISILKFRCYDSLWKCGGEKEVASIFTACLVALIPSVVLIKVAGFNFDGVFYIFNLAMIITAMIFLRVMYRTMRRVLMHMRLIQNASDSKKVLVVGAGRAGNMILRELFENPELKKVPVGVVDDDRNKIGKQVFGVPVLGTTEDISNIVQDKAVDEIIFCIANINPIRKKEIINICKNTKCKVKTIPGIYEIIDEKVNLTKLRDIQIEDLLGREPVKMNLSDMDKIIKNKTVMVTGGGGSIGSELCRQIAKYEPRKLIIVDIYENNAYEIQQELVRQRPELDLDVMIASVRDEEKMDSLFEIYKPEVVFHAAAHKHVPLMEYSPCEAIKNNVFGTLNVAKIADKYKVKKFVLISTDKAVNPTNIMGATKRCC